MAVSERPIAIHQACPKCGGSDSASIWESGMGYCHSCQSSFKTEGRVEMKAAVVDFAPRVTLEEINECPQYALASRGISLETVQHFGVKMGVGTDGAPASHFYPFTKNGKTVAFKERKLPKEFRTHGDFKGAELFGQSNCGGGRMLVITEGELDAMAMAEAYKINNGRYYPVVSLPNGTGSIQALTVNRDFIRKFETVVLMFDNDEPGQAAIAEAAKIVGLGRAKVATLPVKDPCDMLKEHGAKALVDAVWQAQTWSPAGIVTGEKIWEAFQARENTVSLPYPDCLRGLNEKLEGIRHGEITLFTSGTGSGKSTVIKEIIFNILATTDHKVGIISLEESIGDTAEKFIAMSQSKRVKDMTEDEKRKGFEEVFADERVMLLDHQGSVSDESLTDKMEYLCQMGCKYLILDHITIAVSEGADGKTGNEAMDKVMSDLLKITKRYDIWMGVISHLRKASGGSFEEGNLPSIDDIKGSGSIKQISFDIVAFARDMTNESEAVRNTIKLVVLKARFTGNTGPCGSAVYNPETTRLTLGGEFDGSIDFKD